MVRTIIRRVLAARSLPKIATAALLLAIATSRGASAEPVLDRVLSSADFTPRSGCSQLRIGFNLRVQYESHFPASTGDELRITVRPLDTQRAISELLTRRESLRAPSDAGSTIKSIEVVSDQSQQLTLIVQFRTTVSFRVAQGADFESVVIAVSGRKPSGACRPDTAKRTMDWSPTIHSQSSASGPDGPVTVVPIPTPASRPLSEDDKRVAGAAMDEGRAALKKGQPEAATKLFNKVLTLPDNDYSAEALELLGLAYQRGKQNQGAEAAYEAYLKKYPAGEGADRVRQRLSGIVTATEQAVPAPTTKAAVRRSPGGFRSASDGSPAWNVSASASQFYIRDDSFRSINDPSIPQNPNDDPEDHRVHRNVLLSSFDLTGSWSTDLYRQRIRFSATEEHDFSGEAGELISVAALYYELAARDWASELRVGRQTRNTGGVLGRFDGALASWQATPLLRVNAVAGSPVARRFDEPFKDGKFLYGVSIDIAQIYEGLDISLYAIEQRDQDWIDRQAIGAEARYLSEQLSAFATVDYDTHYRELNAAILSSTWTWPDKSALSGAIEFRKSPFLSTWTALQGQPFLTLYDLLKAHTLSEVEQLALDRTTEYRSATLGYSRLLTADVQINLDVTATDTSGAPGSGGVPEMPDTGTEVYYSAQLIASNVLSAGDAFTTGFRFADLETSNLYVVDLSARYPLTDAWRIGPRLRLGYREGDGDGDGGGLTEYTVLPSVLINYYWTRDLALELEAGANWTKTEDATSTVEETEFFFTFGYRYDFYADKN